MPVALRTETSGSGSSRDANAKALAEKWVLCAILVGLGFRLFRTPHPVIVTIRDNRDYIRVLL